MNSILNDILVGTLLLHFTTALTNPGPKFVLEQVDYKICYPDSHCITCSQNISAFKYKTPFSQNEYRLKLPDQINRVRSRYAIEEKISNMMLTLWNAGLESMAETLAINGKWTSKCFDTTNPSEKSYEILDFTATLKVEDTSYLDIILREQFNNLTAQLLNSSQMLAFNLNEIGCCYTYDIDNIDMSMVSTLLRCLLYNKNRLNVTTKYSEKLCLDCDTTDERCVNLDWYRGLCVINRFNEAKWKLALEPEVPVILKFNYIKLAFRGSIYGLNLLVLFLIVYVLYATVVVRRHNREYGFATASNFNEKKRISERSTVVTENIYSEI